jgi:hypothetical protein
MSGSLCTIFNIFIIIPFRLLENEKKTIQEEREKRIQPTRLLSTLQLHFATSIPKSKVIVCERQRVFSTFGEGKRRKEEENSIKTRNALFRRGLHEMYVVLLSVPRWFFS